MEELSLADDRFNQNVDPQLVNFEPFWGPSYFVDEISGSKIRNFFVVEAEKTARYALPFVRNMMNMPDHGSSEKNIQYAEKIEPPLGIWKSFTDLFSTSFPLEVEETIIMRQREHGTCEEGPQEYLKWRVDHKTADRLCCFNREEAEPAQYAYNKPRTYSTFLDTLGNSAEVIYYDSVSGKPLFMAPKGRTMEEFIAEGKKLGWPSFRDQEVNWDNVRQIKNTMEMVSMTGTHLGHNLKDSKGNRYCINLCSIAGKPYSIKTD